MSSDYALVFDPTTRMRCCIEIFLHSTETELVFDRCENESICGYYHEGRGEFLAFCEKHKKHGLGARGLRRWNEEIQRYE